MCQFKPNDKIATAIDTTPLDERLMERKEIPLDIRRFDAVSRQLGVASSRRGAMRALAAGGLGLGLARIGLQSASAGGKKRLGARCQKSSECKGALKCKKSNSEHGCFVKTKERCCKPLGAPCTDGCDCCDVAVICNGGYCDAT
jgi:hypothetical protein